MKPWIVPCTFFLLLVAGAVSLRAAAPAPRWRTAGSVYPPEALAKRIEGQGTVRVTTDSSGWVQAARMEHSTGSKILDEATLHAARTYWQGPPGTTAVLPVEYRLPKTSANPKLPPVAHPGWTLPAPSYPAGAGDDYEQGRGLLRITTNALGLVDRAVMITSTGYARLDADAVHNAEAQWNGPPRATREVPVTYLIPSKTSFAPAKPGDRVHTPIPPYPYKARSTNGSGTGLIRFTTNARGRVARATMIRSTGNADLDENTINFALANWSGPPNRTINVPVTYRLQ